MAIIATAWKVDRSASVKEEEGIKQRQLLDFIRRSVSDSLTQAHEALQTLTPDNVSRIVTGIYEQAFGILQTIAEAEAEE